ncbi:hypothetical protein N7527_007051 [Penicillium freii]|nr:hypothetical protein N7527_007051 [Penicillium freii]
MSYKLIFFFFSYILTLCALSTRHEEKGEAVLAELVCLAEEKGGAVMNSVATNLILMVVVCFFALKGCSSGSVTGIHVHN